jgi:glycerophosphoryl diester phosphodiesterase
VFHRPYVIAHRGISGRYPENTLLAFEKAIEAGTDWIELDVQTSTDDVVFLAHDGSAERTTDGYGLFKNMSLAQVKALDAGSYMGAQFAGERIPTLEETLDFVDGRVRLCIEIKGHTTADSLRTAWETVSILRKRNYLQRVVVSSFDPQALQTLKTWEPLIATSLDPTPQDGSLTPWELCQQVLGNNINAMQHTYDKITPELLDECHQHGFSLWAWTVNEPDDMRRVIELGVDAIMTNYADTLRGIVDEMELAARS